MARTERKSKRRRDMVDWLVLLRSVDGLQNAASFSRKILKRLGLSKRKEWPCCFNVSSWQGGQNHFCQRKKEQSNHTGSPYRETGESQYERKQHFCKKYKNQSGSRESKG